MKLIEINKNDNLNALDYIPIRARIVLAVWTSMIVMISVSLFLYEVKFNPFDLMSVLLASNIASITVALQVGTLCKRL